MKTTIILLAALLLAPLTGLAAVPYEPYRSFDGKYFYRSISPDSRGRFAPIYERIVYHYHGRSDLEMPYSREVVAKCDAGGRSGGAHIPWGALMFANHPAGDDTGSNKS
jgi:hypothetical protein